jgi:hypothetical protein
MKTHYYITIIFFFLFGNCSSWKDTMVTNGDQSDAVQNAIADFLHSGGNLLKEDTVFSVHVEDINKDVLEVWIIGHKTKLAPNSKNRIGTKYPGFPTRFFESEGKLFYWYDPVHNITDDLVAALSKYRRIDSLNVNGFVGWVDSGPNDDSKKSADYFFCKCNLRIYTKVHSIYTKDEYSLSKLDCSCATK